MTDREKAIVMTYTGKTMLTGDKFHIFLNYVNEIMGRQVYIHELANDKIVNEVKEKAESDFITLCNSCDKMITKKQLDIITQDLKEKIWRNEELQDEYYTECNYSVKDRTNMIYIISTLHNLLYEAVTGEPYDYAWHWLNKVNGLSNDGCDTIYDELIGRKED